MTNTPILLVYFNRPSVLEQNLRALQKLRPARLFLASDGPRAGNAADPGKIEACHQLVADLVSWPCQINTLRSDTNLGCDLFVPKAITWFFEQVDEGIILEDDCLIDHSFYGFATQMLDRYRDDKQVMSISGTNFQNRKWGDGDYYFSRYPLCWGWATWARSWNLYDSKMNGLETFLRTRMKGVVSSTAEKRFWKRFLRRLKAGRYTFWDGKWVLSIWLANGVTIAPNRNFVTNIGFGPDATHTVKEETGMTRPIEPLENNVAKAPTSTAVCSAADHYWFDTRIKPTLAGRIATLLRRLHIRLRVLLPSPNIKMSR